MNKTQLHHLASLLTGRGYTCHVEHTPNGWAAHIVAPFESRTREERTKEALGLYLSGVLAGLEFSLGEDIG